MKTQLEWWMAIGAARAAGYSGLAESMIALYWREQKEKAHAG